MKTRAAQPFLFKCCGLALHLFTTLLIVAALFVSCTSLQPEDGPVYRSEQGYSIGLPPQWLVVSRLAVGEKENPIATDNPRIRSLFTAEVLKALKEKYTKNE